MSNCSSAKAVTPHSILTSKLIELEDQLDASQITEGARKTLRKCVDLATGLDSYLDQVSTKPSEELAELELATRQTDWDNEFEQSTTDLHLEQEMISGGLEGQFLRLIVRIVRPKRVLEIGTFTGYSAMAMAEALDADAELIGCEFDSYAAEFARRHLTNAGFENRVKIFEGDALETLASLDGQFDLVFIDADKTGYLNYYNLLFSHNLVSSGSLILIDNSLYQGEVYSAGEVSANGEAVRQFNALVAADARVDQVLLPLRDGVTIIRVN